MMEENDWYLGLLAGEDAAREARFGGQHQATKDLGSRASWLAIVAVMLNIVAVAGGISLDRPKVTALAIGALLVTAIAWLGAMRNSSYRSIFDLRIAHYALYAATAMGIVLTLYLAFEAFAA
jgi:hypothetical protein